MLICCISKKPLNSVSASRHLDYVYLVNNHDYTCCICSAQSKNRYDSGIVPAQSRNPTLSADSGIVPDNSRIAQGIYIGLPSDIICAQSKNRVGQSRNLMGSAK